MCARQLIVFLLLCCIGYSSSQLTEFGKTTNLTFAKPLNLYTINCTRDSDCTPNAYCFYGRCTCKSDYIPDRDATTSIVKCIKRAVDLEDYCEKDVQCEANLGNHAICRKQDPNNPIGKCACADDAHYIDRLCHKTAYIGHACQGNDNCLIRSQDVKAFCVYGSCTCPPHYHEIDGGKDCVVTSELNGPCKTTDSCITMNSECRDSFCKCKMDFIPDNDNICLQLSQQIGDPCEQDAQCTVKIPHSKCDLSKAICACQEGYHKKEERCWHTAHVTERCENINECRRDDHHDRGILCVDNICQCKYGYYLEENKFCMKLANYTEKDENGGWINNVSLYLLIGCLIFNNLQNKMF